MCAEAVSLQRLLAGSALGGGTAFSVRPEPAAQSADLARRRAALQEMPSSDAGGAVLDVLGEVVVQWWPTGTLPARTPACNATSDAPFDLRFSFGSRVSTPGDPCTLEELVRRADAVMHVDTSSRPSRSAAVARLPEQASSRQADGVQTPGS